MRQLVVLATVLIVGVSLAQAQGRGTRNADRRSRQELVAVRAAQATDDALRAQGSIQRAIRQRVRDPGNCQVAGDRPLQQRLRDPASCTRFNAASRRSSLGSGWGCLRRGARAGGWDRSCCLVGRCCRYQGGRHHGWRQ